MIGPLCSSTSEDTEPNCPICRDRRWLYTEENGYRQAELCSCQLQKQARRRMELSGLIGALDSLTFDTFLAKEPWQQGLLKTARKYADHVLNGGKSWMYMGGQPGCGKTHLCTAACGEFLKKGIQVRYMLWTDHIRRIKAGITDSEAAAQLLDPLKYAPVLYVDDLFKGQSPTGMNTPTASDLRLAFEIINSRYVQNLPTIISSEWNLQSLLDVDQGAFSRVYQKCKGFTDEVQRDGKKNYRLAAEQTPCRHAKGEVPEGRSMGGKEPGGKSCRDFGGETRPMTKLAGLLEEKNAQR